MHAGAVAGLPTDARHITHEVAHPIHLCSAKLEKTSACVVNDA